MAEQKRLAEIVLRVKADNASIQRAQRDLDEFRKSMEGVGDAADDVKKKNSALGNLASGSQKLARSLSGLGAGGLGQIFAAIDDVNDISEVAGKQMGKFGLAVTGIGAVAVAAGLALQEMNRQLEGNRRALEAAIDGNRLYYETIGGGGTRADIEKQIAELERRAEVERNIIRDTTNAIQIAFESEQKARGDAAARLLFAIGDADDKAQKAIDDSNVNLSKYEAQIRALNVALESGEVAANDTAAATEEATKVEKELSDARLKAATEDGQRILAENEKIFAAIARQNEQLASAYQKYEQDIANLQDTYQQDRIQAEKDYQQTLVDITDAAAKAAEDALARLTEKRDQLAADFAQGEIDAQRQLELDRQQIIIDAQRQEAQAYRDHQRNLRDIQIEAARERERLAEDRDFAGLFDLERQTSQRMEDANRAFEDERSDRQIALEQERTDLLASYEIERQQRFEQYQRNLIDAQAQYQRELQLAERNRREALSRAQQAYSAELTMLYQKLQTEMEARRQAALAEITLINQTEQQKLAIIEQYAIAARNFLASTFAPVTAPAGNNTSVAFTQNVNVAGAGAGFGAGMYGTIRSVTRGVLQDYFG